MWTFFKYFLYSLWQNSFALEVANAKNAYIGNTNNTCTGGIYAKISFVGGTGDVSTVKNLGIHLQSS